MNPAPSVARVPAPGSHHGRPPGPRGLPPLGIGLDLVTRGLLPPLQDAWHRFGDAVYLPLPGEQAFLFVHPDAVHRVLVQNRNNYVKGVTFDNVRLLTGNGLLTSDGELWARQRQHLQPGFHAQRLQALVASMIPPIAAFADEWGAMPGGTHLDLLTAMKELTFRVATTTLLRFDADPREGAMHAVSKAFLVIAQRFTQIFPLPLWVPTPKNLELRRALATLRPIVERLIDDRRRTPGDDLISMMLRARDPDGSPMSEAQLYDEIVTLFLAGYETTAVTLTWTIAMLADNPAVAKRLGEECSDVLAGRVPTLDDLPRLPYTRMVLEESLRLYPSTWLVARNAVADDDVMGWRVPAGARVFLGCYFTHHHPEFWDEPERCDPDRFLPERVHKRHRYAYYPFGAGQRICMGKEFALMEGQLILATLMQRFRIAPTRRAEPAALGTLQPRGGLPVVIHPLQPWGRA